MGEHFGICDQENVIQQDQDMMPYPLAVAYSIVETLVATKRWFTKAS